MTRLEIGAGIVLILAAGGFVAAGLHVRERDRLNAERSRREDQAREEAEEERQRDEAKKAAQEEQAARIAAMRTGGIEVVKLQASSIYECALGLNLDRIPPGKSRQEAALTVAAWSIRAASWERINSAPKTTMPEAMKDELGSSGKTVCGTFVVDSIKTGRANDDGTPFYVVAGKLDDRPAFTYAVGDTTGIVDGSTGRFCGAFLLLDGATFSFVGMFDTKKNHP